MAYVAASGEHPGCSASSIVSNIFDIDRFIGQHYKQASDTNFKTILYLTDEMRNIQLMSKQYIYAPINLN